jgi:tetratricopeptide (TPR) repeat protein
LYYAEYGRALHQAGNHVRENEIYDIGLNLFPDGWHILWPKAVCALSNADTINANKYLSKIRSIATGLGYSKSLIENVIGLIYGEANIADQAEVFFRKAYELEPQKIGRILWLAGCLINNDINVEEGMQLVQKGLEIEPDNAVLFWIQGRGYYKQGKYEESVLLLRKVMGEEGFINPDLCKHLREAEQALANQSK